MANLINATGVDYTALNNSEYFIKAIRKGVTLSNDYFRLIPNVTKEVKVKKAVLNGGTVSQFDSRDCSWTPVQRINITSKTMNVIDFKINFEQCLDELDNLYSEQLYSAGANKTELPENLEGVLLELIQTSMGNDIEKIIWGGNGNAVDGVQNGLVDKLLVDPNSIKLTAVPITKANVTNEIEKVYDAIPNAVLQDKYYDPVKANVRIFIDGTTMRYLRTALGNAATALNVLLPNWTIVENKIYFNDVEVVYAGVPQNVIVAGSYDNLIVVTDLTTDLTFVKAALGNQITDENIFYVKGKYRVNADYIFSDEVVIYS
jgi:hypothetical protein